MIIKLEDFKKTKKDKLFNEQLLYAVEFLNSLDPQVANDIIAAVLTMVVYQCKVGLGITEDEKITLAAFNIINSIYQEAAGQCYFCRELDPNEEKVDKSTSLCMFCRMKLKNMMEYLM